MKRVVSLMLVIAMVMTAACGCKRGTQEGTQQSGNASSETNYGGTVTVGITQDLDSLDPHKATAAGTKEVLYNIFEGLVKADKDGNLVPTVASSYDVLDGGAKYVFTLREGVKFHNGKVVTADDVIYSLKRSAGMLGDSEAGVQVVSALSVITEIKASEDGKKVELVLDAPNTELIGYLTCAIIPCDYNEQDSKPVGTGPFKFVSYAPLEKLVVEKSPDYHVAGVPYLDGVTFKIEANNEAAFLELMGGSIDIFPYLTNEQAAQMPATHEVLVGSMNLVQGLFLNNLVEPFNNLKVRQALCHAVNKQQILDMLNGGMGAAIGSAMFTGFGKYFNDDVTNMYEYNPEKAKKLLTEAGYPDGFTFTIIVPSNYSYHVSTTEILVEQLKAVGVTAKIQLVEWATWLSDVYSGRQFEATVIGLDSQLAPSDVFRFYPSNAKRNFINYFSDEFDAEFELAKNAVDDGEKVAHYKKVQEIMAKDAASVYIQAPTLMVAVNKKLAGYTFYPIYVQDMSTVYYK